MSDKLVEKIRTTISELENQRENLDQQINNCTDQFKVLGAVVGVLEGILTAEAVEVVKETKPCILAFDEFEKSHGIPPLSEIEKAARDAAERERARIDALDPKILSHAIQIALDGLRVEGGGENIDWITARVKHLGYKSRSKNLRALVLQCLTEPKNKKLFKRISRGVYALATKGK